MATHTHIPKIGDSRRSARAIDPALLQALANPAPTAGRSIVQIPPAQALQEASVLADVVSCLGEALLADPERGPSGSCFSLLAELLGDRLDIVMEGGVVMTAPFDFPALAGIADHRDAELLATLDRLSEIRDQLDVARRRGSTAYQRAVRSTCQEFLALDTKAAATTAFTSMGRRAKAMHALRMAEADPDPTFRAGLRGCTPSPSRLCMTSSRQVHYERATPRVPRLRWRGAGIRLHHPRYCRHGTDPAPAADRDSRTRLAAPSRGALGHGRYSACGASTCPATCTGTGSRPACGRPGRSKLGMTRRRRSAGS